MSSLARFRGLFEESLFDRFRNTVTVSICAGELDDALSKMSCDSTSLEVKGLHCGCSLVSTIRGKSSILSSILISPATSLTRVSFPSRERSVPSSRSSSIASSEESSRGSNFSNPSMPSNRFRSEQGLSSMIPFLSCRFHSTKI